MIQPYQNCVEELSWVVNLAKVLRLSRAGRLLVPGWNCCWGEICARCEV